MPGWTCLGVARHRVLYGRAHHRGLLAATGLLTLLQTLRWHWSLTSDATGVATYPQHCNLAVSHTDAGTSISRAPDRSLREGARTTDRHTPLARSVVQAIIDDLGPAGRVLLRGGSLLGWLREGNVIAATDHDIDLGLSPLDWNRLSWRRVRVRAACILLRQWHIADALQVWIGLLDIRLGLSPFRVGYAQTFSQPVFSVDSRGVSIPGKDYYGLGALHVDVWLHHSNGTHTLEYDDWGREHAYTLREMQAVRCWDGLQFYVPVRAEEAIAERFGSGWKTPVKWDLSITTTRPEGGTSTKRPGIATVFNDCVELPGRIDPYAYPLDMLNTLMLVLCVIGVGMRAGVSGGSGGGDSLILSPATQGKMSPVLCSPILVAMVLLMSATYLM